MKSWGAIILAAAGLSAPAPARAPADATAIRALQQAQADAWNAHDIDAYAALFTVDADVINVLGWHWKDRAELKAKLGRGFASVFAHSAMSIGETDVTILTPEIAVAHVRWTLSGARSPTGSAADTPKQGIQTQVLVKRDGVWRIAEFQNTNSQSERPLPGPE
jgi:uncharacterized protein (TIGR02246 family)